MMSMRAGAAQVMTMFAGGQLRARSFRATALVVSSFGAQKVLQLGSNLILTRILFPEAFGLMALVTVFVAGLSLMSDVGIQASLVRSTRSDEPVFQSTAWTLQVARGLMVTALAWLLAWPYARLYEEPLLFPLICVSALSASAGGFKSIQTAIRQRNLILGKVMVLQVVGQGLSVGLTVLAAWLLQSVWGLAIGNVVGALAMTLLSHLLLPSANHRFAWDRSVLSEIVVFGRWILLATFFTFLGDRGIQAIRGYLTDLETLAFLHIAAMFALMVVELAKAVMSSVVYPVLSQIVRDRPQDLKAMMGRVRVLQTGLSTPSFIAIAAVAVPMIDLLYDDRYAAAGPYLALMALGNAIGAAPMVYQSALLALGDSRAHAFVMILSSGLRIAGAIAGYEFGGIHGMILGDAVALLVVYAVSATVAARKGLATFGIDLANLAVIACAYAILLTSLF